MILIKITPESNGAHASQISSATIVPPDGWAIVPEHLEIEARRFLPFVLLTIEGGDITSIEDNPDKPPPTPEPEPTPDYTAFVAALYEKALEGYAE